MLELGERDEPSAEMRKALSGRRDVLRGLVLGGQALVIGTALPSASWASGKPRRGADEAVTAWVRIAENNTVTLIASQSEMGQGTTTTLAAILAEELGIPFGRVLIEFGPL